MIPRSVVMLVVVLVLSCPSSAYCADDVDAGLHRDAITAMQKAATFYRTKLATHGGYVYYYSLDLRERWGEGPPACFPQYGDPAHAIAPPQARRQLTAPRHR